MRNLYLVSKQQFPSRSLSISKLKLRKLKFRNKYNQTRHFPVVDFEFPLWLEEHFSKCSIGLIFLESVSIDSKEVDDNTKLFEWNIELKVGER